MCGGFDFVFSTVGLVFQLLHATVVDKSTNTLNQIKRWCLLGAQFVIFGVQLQLQLQLLTLQSISNLTLTSNLKLKLKLNLKYDFTNVEKTSRIVLGSHLVTVAACLVVK